MVEAAAHESPTHFIEAANRSMQGKTIFDHAKEQMRQGATSVAEVMRISNQIED